MRNMHATRSGPGRKPPLFSRQFNIVRTEKGIKLDEVCCEYKNYKLVMDDCYAPTMLSGAKNARKALFKTLTVRH